MGQGGDKSPYTKWIGQSVIRNSERDEFNNPKGNEYDLAKSNAFKGMTIVILQLYTGEGFDFKLPGDTLISKGFQIICWNNGLPDFNDFKKGLATACQLWVISREIAFIKADYLKEIIKFFNEGNGLYVWGDNEPFFADANQILAALFNSSMYGNIYGDCMIGIKTSATKSGIVADHPISTGIENFYEGITIASIKDSKDLSPLIYGSDGQVIASVHEKNGRRAIVDGGFTRLFLKWHSAGTARYVANAAAWLANYERFGLGSKGFSRSVKNILNKF